MEKADIITLEAVGEFPFEFFIEKAVPTDDEKEMILEGVASTTNIDHDHERMTKEAIESMANVINEKGVPLRVEHSKDDDAIIGEVYQASVDERNQLHIKARLNKNHMAAPILYRAMQTGAKMGFSVGGIVKHAIQEFSEKLGKVVKTFYDVALNEVSVTPRPANYDAWAIAKSIATDAAEAEQLRGTDVYNRFLFENPHLDYLQAFAKSIPDGAWRKTASQTKTTYMAKDTKKEVATEDTEKAVSRSEFNTLTSLMSKGFESISAVLTKMTGDDAMDQHAPNEKKPDPEKVTAKAEDGAMDQNNPDEKKPEPEKVTAKAEEDETETKTKSEEKETETEKKGDDSTEGEYDLETVKGMIKSMDALSSKLSKAEETETEMKTKAESETEEDTKKTEENDMDTKEKSEDKDDETTTKGQHPLDTLVFSMAKAMLAMSEHLEKDGKRVPGLERNFVSKMQNDPEFQKELKNLMAVPGFKKSVSMGVAYVPTKEGGRMPLSLVASTQTTVEKSKDSAKGETFESLYKKQFSSFAEEE